MRHVIVMTMTSALGLTFTFFIDFLSLFWLARLENQTIIASVTIAGAIMFFTVSLSVALMIPAVALVSRSIGRGEREKARHDATAAIILAVGFQTFLALLVMVFLRPLVEIIGGNEHKQVLDYAEHFLAIVIPSLPIFAIAMIASALLRAEGDGVRSMLVTFAGGFIAMILDPILIIMLDMGITGAGIVIVIARIIMAAIGLYFLIGKYDLIAPLRSVNLRPFLPPFIAIALPAMLAQLSTPFGNIILTRYVSDFGEAALAGWAVNFRLMLVAFGGVFALSGAIGGIIGQNYGAGKMERVQSAYIDAIKFGTIYTLLTWVILLLVRPFIPAIFSLEAASIGIVNIFIFTAWYFFFVSALFVSNAAFNNLGRPLWTTGFNWLRDGILTIPVAAICTGMMGAEGAVIAQVVLGIAIGLFAGIVGWRFLGQVARGEVVVERRKR